MSRWPVRISQTGSGPTPPGDSLDRFAPKYLVGNTSAGDPDTPSTAGLAAGFNYFPDTGNGAGIAAALSAAAATGGDVWIRPGTYNFGLVGSPLTPLTIAGGVRVQGAGNTTILHARPTGDQGVFVMAAGGPGADESAFSSLRDLAIIVPGATEDPGGSSLGVVLVKAGGVAITGVNIEMATNPASVIRHAILIDTGGANVVPPISIETTSLNLTVAANPPVLSSAIRVIEGQVAARNVTIIGGDIGVEITNNNIDSQSNSGGALFFGIQLLVANPSQYAVLVKQLPNAVNAAAVRIADSVFFHDFSSTPPLGAGSDVGAALEASFVSTFRSVILIGFATGFDVRPVNRDLTASVQIDDCGIVLCDLGVRFGSGAVGCSVSDTEIGTDAPFPPNPILITANKGVLVENSGGAGVAPAGISITNNTINVDDFLNLGPNTYGVRASGADNVFIEGNEITHGSRRNTLATVYITDSTDVVVADNHIQTESLVAAILIEQTTPSPSPSRTTVTGNTITMPNAAKPPVGIDVMTAQQVTITGNAINHQPYKEPSISAGAIRLTSSGQEGFLPMRCTVTGNAVLPSSSGAATAILINASENTCANNVCSQDVPPATSAIIVGGNNNVILGNVCRTATPVANTGLGNEVAHNI